MANVNITGALPTRRVAAGDKFRAVWKLQLLPIVGGSIIDAPKAAAALINTLPKAGFAPVSNPSAKTGDLAVVVDVRLSSTGSWSGKTVGNIASELQQLSRHAGFFDALILNDLELSSVEALSLTLTSSQLETGQSGAQQQAQQQQQEAGWLEQLKKWLERITFGAGLAVVVIVAGGVAYWYVTKRRR